MVLVKWPQQSGKCLLHAKQQLVICFLRVTLPIVQVWLLLGPKEHPSGVSSPRANFGKALDGVTQCLQCSSVAAHLGHWLKQNFLEGVVSGEKKSVWGNVEPFRLPAHLSLSSFLEQILLPHMKVNLNLLFRNW